MEKKLFRRLGPSAKNLSMGSPDTQVSTLVTLAPSVDASLFRQQVEQAKGTVRSWMPEANIASVDIKAGDLEALAGVDGVVYVEAGAYYTR